MSEPSSLLVIASARITLRAAQQDEWTLRLAGVSRSDEVAPPHLEACAADAAREIRTRFPEWLHRWVCETRAADVHVFPGPTSWWWLTEISEMSPLRSAAIRQLYWLALVRGVIERHHPARVEWHGDDQVLASLVARICASLDTPCRLVVRPAHLRTARLVARFGFYTLVSLLRWALVRSALRPSPDDERGRDSLLFTRFPILWEYENDRWRERMYGTWPDYLQVRGHRVAYAAVYAGSLWHLAGHLRAIRTLSRSLGILYLEGYLRAWDWLVAHLPLRFWIRYWRWRRRHVQRPIDFNGLDVRRLWWREIDGNAFGLELPRDLELCLGLQRLMRRATGVATVYHPFEFQPMERAVWAGVKSIRNPTIVGLQTGIFTSNQMGFTFLASDVRGESADYSKAPLPDVLAAYGHLPYSVFSERLGASRVLLTGPIRYPELDATQQPRDRSLDAAEGRPFVLVTTSISLAESVPLLDAVLALAARRKDFRVGLKFHYHLPLTNIARDLARTHGVVDYEVFDSGLYDLIRASTVLVCAGSSTGVEAMQLGCMPLVYVNPAEMSANPLLDIADAVFLWTTLDQLNDGLDAVLHESSSYAARRARWPEALAAQCLANPRANEDLYERLKERQAL